jgi:thiosulfate dehydrogenase [quinone] large subunit
MRLPGELLQGILARAALVLLRVYLGVVVLVDASAKIREDFTPRLLDLIQNVGLEQGHPFYREFLRSVVLPNVELFARLVTWGELLVGILLVLGLCTRLAAASAFLVLLNYLWARGAWFWTPSSSDAALSLIALALIVGAAGRTLGFDSLLARRWPRSALW